MNAFKEPVTPRNSSVPVQKSVLHHFKRPAGRGGLIRSAGHKHSPSRVRALFSRPEKKIVNAHGHTRVERERI